MKFNFGSVGGVDERRRRVRAGRAFALVAEVAAHGRAQVVVWPRSGVERGLDRVDLLGRQKAAEHRVAVARKVAARARRGRAAPEDRDAPAREREERRD